MSDSYETILYEVDDPVALITLNRPERMNAWTFTMAGEVYDAVRRAEADRRVVGVILTGAGRAFCSGADLKDMSVDDLEKQLASGGPDPASSRDDGGSPMSLDYLMKSPKPVIAAVNGAAAGMGAVIALWCDLRFMADNAFVTMSFSQRGTVAESGSSWLLPRLIGSAAALDILISSRRVTAAEALQIGLVNGTASPLNLIGSAREYIETLAQGCSPASMATIKRQLYTELHDGLMASAKNSGALLAEAIKGGDIEEGWKSYLEKRPPQFARLGTD